MTYKITSSNLMDWLNLMLDRADLSNDEKVKCDANGRYIRTPIKLCKEIVQHISLNINLKDKKILVVDTVEFIPVLLIFGAEKCNITYIAPYEFKGRIAKYLGTRQVQKSILDWEPDMKFDVVIGNPPYQDETNSNLYKSFIKKSKEIGDIVSLIVPSSNFKENNEFNSLISYSFKGNYFKTVQLLVSWFIWKRDYTGPIEVLIPDGNKISMDNILVAPTTDIKRFEIVNKLLEKGYAGLSIKNGKLSRNKAELDPNGIWCIWSCGYSGRDFDKVKVSEEQRNLLSGFGDHKVVFSGDYTTTAIGPTKYAPPDHGCAMKANYILVQSIDEANNLISYLNSKFIKFIISDIKGTSTKNGKTVFGRIPKLDFTRSWTDEELYFYFGLTQEEIDYIEETVK